MSKVFGGRDIGRQDEIQTFCSDFIVQANRGIVISIENEYHELPVKTETINTNKYDSNNSYFPLPRLLGASLFAVTSIVYGIFGNSFDFGGRNWNIVGPFA
jgi:hypothetical protein